MARSARPAASASTERSADLLRNTTPAGLKRKVPTQGTHDHGPVQKKSKSKSKTAPRRQRNGIHGPSTTTDDMPFTVEYPISRATMDNWKDDIYRAKDSIGVPDLYINYAIRPGKLWENMKYYKKVRLHETDLSSGQFVYVAKSNPLPEPPPIDASMEESLAYDQANFWIARIAECKAVDSQHVYLRVWWLYWPDELPGGRRPYHGKNEVIMSNAMDIIDATTVADPVNVVRWSEHDLDEELGYLFWRQTLDVGYRVDDDKKKSGSHGHPSSLSEIRKHCACKMPYNPDLTMYLCVHPMCGTWNHEECLRDSILSQTFDKFSRGELHQEKATVNNEAAEEQTPEVQGKDAVEVPESSDTVLKTTWKMLTGQSRPVKVSEKDSHVSPEAKDVTPMTDNPVFGSRKTFVPPMNDKERPWLKFFGASIKVKQHPDQQPNSDEGAVVAVIHDKRRNVQKQEWVEDLYCLSCEAKLE